MVKRGTYKTGGRGTPAFENNFLYPNKLGHHELKNACSLSMERDQMIRDATKRSIFRWIHIIFAIPIIGYVYEPSSDGLRFCPSCGFRLDVVADLLTNDGITAVGFGPLLMA